MSKPITTFEDFVKRVVKVVIWVIVLFIIVAVPVYYLLGRLFHFPVDLLALFTAKLSDMPAFFTTFLNTEPTKTLFALVVFPGFSWVALYGTVFMGWVERKFTAKIQLRTGPMYAGKVEGIGQNVADFMKLLFKEMIIPYGVDRAAFVAVPFALMGVVGGLIALVPVSPAFYIANPPVGAVLVFAVLGFTPIIVLLAGWASNSKYPFLGGLRALHQMVAYEIPLVLSLVGAVILSGSLNLAPLVPGGSSIVTAQSRVWFIVLQPLGAIVFFIGALAEVERIPFDIPEADTELVSGWQTEYSSMFYGTFQLVNFSRMYVMAGLFTTFFLGGWLGPAPVPPEIWFILKLTVVMVFMMLPRSIMPRIRIDMMLRAGWVRLLALAFANIFLAMLLVSLGVT